MTIESTELASVPTDDLEWAHESVKDVSRTFAITIRTLDEPMSSYVCIGYLMCRVADTIEDSIRLAPADKADLLDQYDRVVNPADGFDTGAFETSVEPHLPAATSDEWEVVANTGRIISTFQQMPADVRGRIVPPTRELVQGMSMFVERHADSGGVRIRTAEELEEYCYYVAGTVGELVTNLVVRDATIAPHRRRLRRDAEGFGMLLQLVNIAKDVRADYLGENNVYLPEEWLDEHGVPQDDVVSTDRTAAVASVIERTTERAGCYLDDAQSYLETLAGIDRNLLSAWAIPFLLAVGTLRELSERPEDVLSESGVKISRDEVAAVVNAVSDVTEPETLASLRKSVRRGELGGP